MIVPFEFSRNVDLFVNFESYHKSIHVKKSNYMFVEL